MGDRRCENCGGSMAGRTPRARFCGRPCQVAAFAAGRRAHLGGGRAKDAVIARLLAHWHPLLTHADGPAWMRAGIREPMDADEAAVVRAAAYPRSASSRAS